MCAGCAGDEDGLDQSTWFQHLHKPPSVRQVEDAAYVYESMFAYRAGG